MSVAPVNFGPLSSGLAGIHGASALLDGAAGEVLAASTGQPADLEGAAVDIIRARHATSASTAVIEAGDAQLEALVDLFT